MNGLSGLHYAESMANERARQVEHRANQAFLLESSAGDHPLRTRLGHGLVRIGMWLAPHQAEPARRVHTSPSC